MPFWDDLALFGNQTLKQGIFYQIFPEGYATGEAAGVTYEYYLWRSGVAGELYHFTVEYKWNTPGVFVYRYISVGGGGTPGQFASVGIQGSEYYSALFFYRDRR